MKLVGELPTPCWVRFSFPPALLPKPKALGATSKRE